MKRRSYPQAFDCLRPALTPFEQMVHTILRYSLGLGVISVLALCMLALALSELPGVNP